MSFQGLISGAECATPANPLSQVLKHTEGDRSLQQDKIAGPSSARLYQLPATSVPQANEQDLFLARQFFEGNVPMNGSMAHPSFNPADLMKMREFNGHVDTNHAQWTMDQKPNASEHMSAQWAAEFGNSPATSPPPMLQRSGPSASTSMSYAPQTAFYGNQMQYPMYNFNAMQQSLPVVHDTGKGKGREADFEAAFARAAESLTTENAQTSRIVEVDSVDDLEDTLKAEPKEELGDEFKKVWEHLQDSDLPPPKEDIATWEAEFNQLMSSQREETSGEYGAAMQQAWETGLGDYDGTSFGDRSLRFDENGLPILGDYVFEAENKYLTAPSTRSLLADAKALLDQNGSLSEAALLLEAAIQKGELGDKGYETWILLGEVRNMDEREEAGMRALTEGVRRAEAADGSGAGMLSLAISFTNESFDRASHTMLLRWLRARYPTHPVPEETAKAVSTNASWDTHTRITDLFLSLAREQHSQGVLDPDLQIGLGVLFYNHSEYDRAKDCFESALSARPKDYLLWNRLGSSLSNGNKPEEALGAYREALQLRPTYTRAIYNVGVACLNINAPREAAEHFLSALALQDSSSGDTSNQVWFTLRRAFISMERPDLAELAKSQTRSSLEVFRREGFEF